MLEDRQKLEAFRRGDPEILEALFRACAPEVWRLARLGFSFRSGDIVRRFSGYPSLYDQQNLVQETFARAFAPEARARYTPLSSYGALLRRIAQNLVVDQLRQGARRGGDLLEVNDPEPDQHASPELPPDEQLRRNAIIATVREVLAGLPERQRHLVSLRFEQQLSQEDTAKRLKVGRAAVRTLERRVRARLRKALRQRGLVSSGSGDLVSASLLLLCLGTRGVP